MSEDQLLPCPFCGGEPEIKRTGKFRLKIRCKKCFMGLEQATLRLGLDWLKNQLFESWNNRV